MLTSARRTSPRSVRPQLPTALRIIQWGTKLNPIPPCCGAVEETCRQLNLKSMSYRNFLVLLRKYTSDVGPAFGRNKNVSGWPGGRYCRLPLARIEGDRNSPKLPDLRDSKPSVGVGGVLGAGGREQSGPVTPLHTPPRNHPAAGPWFTARFLSRVSVPDLQDDFQDRFFRRHWLSTNPSRSGIESLKVHLHVLGLTIKCTLKH